MSKAVLKVLLETDF